MQSPAPKESLELIRHWGRSKACETLEILLALFRDGHGHSFLTRRDHGRIQVEHLIGPQVLEVRETERHRIHERFAVDVEQLGFVVVHGHEMGQAATECGRVQLHVLV